MLLEVRDLTVRYEKAVALRSVSLHVAEGEVVTIIGANGAGKSTVLKVLSGLWPSASGEVYFDGRKIDGMQPYDIIRFGLVHIPEGRRLFPYLNVLQNLQLGASLRKDKDGIRQDLEWVFDRFPILHARRNQKAGSLSGGEQMMLAIGRGLMAKPRLLLMDEPSLGLSPLMVAEVAHIIEAINEARVSVLLVEQNVFLAMKVARRGYLLEVGQVVLGGDIEEFRDNDMVRRGYLGE
jgi:branched-chain amino acid transport system ATP-binding protein